MDPHQWMRFIECHPGLSGYLQFMGAILALVVAIAVPIRIALRDRAERNELRLQRSGSMATSLVGAVWLLEADIDRVRKSLDRYKDHAPDALSWSGWFSEIELRVPEELSSSISLMHDMFEQIIGPFRQSAMLAMTFNGYRAKFSQISIDAATARWPELYGYMDSGLRLTLEAVAKAQAVVNSARQSEDKA